MSDKVMSIMFVSVWKAVCHCTCSGAQTVIKVHSICNPKCMGNGTGAGTLGL